MKKQSLISFAAGAAVCGTLAFGLGFAQPEKSKGAEKRSEKAQPAESFEMTPEMMDAMFAETLAEPEPTVAVPLETASKPTLPPPSSLDLTVLSHTGLPPEVVQLLSQAIMITHQVQHPQLSIASGAPLGAGTSSGSSSLQQRRLWTLLRVPVVLRVQSQQACLSKGRWREVHQWGSQPSIT